MAIPAGLEKKIENITTDTFVSVALEIFRYQVRENSFYQAYLKIIGFPIDRASEVKRLEDIPFLPIAFFKKHTITTGNWEPTNFFLSSGTTEMVPSRHAVYSKEAYLKNCRRGFQNVLGADPGFFCWLALLPSYLEREGSSLIAMVDDFIHHSAFSESGFYLNNTDALLEKLAVCRQKNIPVILLGVSFALWDLAESLEAGMDLSGTIVMETGGMKGRREEIIREELHGILKKAFGLDAIYSEYGMTELSSQAYSKGEGIFVPTTTMQVLAREINDPFTILPVGKTGVLNVVDLANVHTCSFIATDDICRIHSNGSFEILGRLDNSDARGCNLMVADLQA